MVDESTRRVWISIPPVMPPDSSTIRSSVDVHVELDLLAHPEAVIQQVGNAALAPAPSSISKTHARPPLTGSELDLACLEMPIEWRAGIVPVLGGSRAGPSMAPPYEPRTRHPRIAPRSPLSLRNVANSDGATVGIVGDLTEEALRRHRLFRTVR